jgi:hypothetical protein
MSYTLADIPTGATEKDLYIAWWDGAKWVKLGTTLDTATKTVSAQVSHFTTFGLIAQLPPTTTIPPTTTAPPTTTVPPATTTSPPASTTPGTSAATTSPPTASDPAEKDDNGNPLLPVGIALIGAAMLLGIVIYRRKGHK